MIGRAAAEARAKANAIQVYFACLMVVFVSIALAAAISHASLLKMAAYVLLIPLAALVVARLWLRHVYFLLVSESLGIKLRAWNDVDLRPDAYEAWCAKHGVAPFQPRSRTAI